MPALVLGGIACQRLDLLVEAIQAHEVAPDAQNPRRAVRVAPPLHDRGLDAGEVILDGDESVQVMAQRVADQLVQGPSARACGCGRRYGLVKRRVRGADVDEGQRAMAQHKAEAAGVRVRGTLGGQREGAYDAAGIGFGEGAVGVR